MLNEFRPMMERNLNAIQRQTVQKSGNLASKECCDDRDVIAQDSALIEGVDIVSLERAFGELRHTGGEPASGERQPVYF